jgi:hypothetical protein
MLIQKKSVSAGDVVVLKVRDVEGEVIARVVSYSDTTTDQHIKIVKPLVAHVVQQQGGIGLAFMPFSLSARDEQEFEFSPTQLLLAPFLARDEVKTTYLEQTTSLKLP